MQARARIKYLKMSPRKMRRVADMIRGKQVQDALNILNFTPKVAAHHLAKTLKSAAANAIASVGSAKLKAEDLSISKIFIDEAPTAKRVRFQSMGRVFRIRKRYCHLTIEVEGEPEVETTRSSRKKAEKAEKAPVEVKEAPAKRKGKKTAVEKEEDSAETAVDTEGADEADNIDSEEEKNKA